MKYKQYSSIRPRGVTKTLYSKRVMLKTVLTYCVSLCLGISTASVASPPCSVQHHSPVNWTVDCSGLLTSELPSNLERQPVTKLNLSHGAFNSSLVFLNWTFLKEIDLSFNYLSHLPDSMFIEFNELKSLNLSSNQIKNISGDHFVGELYLQTLDLSNNTELASNKNFLTDLHPILCRGVQFLILRSTGLKEIPRKYFDGVYELKFLDLQRNRMEKLPKFPSSLVRLDISENLFEEITLDNFDQCINLEILIIENNEKFEFLSSDAFHFLKKLVKLSLRGNKKLSYLPDGLFFHNHLKRLDLSDCAFKTLSPGFIAPFKQLEIVQLHNNPWQCDHAIAWFRKLNTSVEDGEMRCANSNTTFTNFFEGGMTHALLWNILIGLLCLNILILVLGLWCSYKLELRARLKHTYSPLDKENQPRKPFYVSTMV